MKFTTLLGVSFTGIAAASPVDLAKRTGTQQLATFDELPSLPGISQINPVNVHKGINYNSFNVVSVGVDVLGLPLTGVIPGVLPQSGRQYIGTSITESLTRGGPAFIIDGESFKSFDLQSLFFGCAVNAVQSVAGVPQQCTIAFTAFKRGSDSAFETINVQFNPSGLRTGLTQARFPRSWDKLSRVDIAVVQATSTEALNVLVVDDVAYKLNR
ncbi:hypothetical protein MBLNU230_g8283t1 [Neophaeotheca triangularis]